MSFTLVDAGKAKSTTLKLSLSSFLVFFLEISGSEQMQTGLIGSSASEDHSRKACPNKEMEGTKNKINPLPLVSFSAMRSEIKVFPVPQAIIILPRSAVLKHSCVLSNASFWCGRINFFGVLESSPEIPCSSLSQSTGDSCKSKKLSRVTGGFWFFIASVAFGPHLFVVEIQSRWAKPVVRKFSSLNSLLEVERKESTAGLSIIELSW